MTFVCNWPKPGPDSVPGCLFPPRQWRRRTVVRTVFLCTRSSMRFHILQSAMVVEDSMNMYFRCKYWPNRHKDCKLPLSVRISSLQGYFTHTKQRPPETPQKDYAWGPMVVLGGGGVLLSEVPLHAMQVVAARMGEMQAEQELRSASHHRAKVNPAQVEPQIKFLEITLCIKGSQATLLINPC